MVGHKELVGLLVRRAGVTAWNYDAKEDCLTYCRPNELTCIQVNELKKGKAFPEWDFLWGGMVSGFADVHDTPWQKGGMYRLTYLRVGDSKDVVGVADKIDDFLGAEFLPGVDLERLASRIDAEMLLLRPREKGVLFVLEAGMNKTAANTAENQNLPQADLLEQTVRSEFRGQDVLSRISNTRYLVFFKGELPIDVIEHRAQVFLDEFGRRAMDSKISTTCSIGIAVTGGSLTSAKALITAAEEALDEVIERGANHYRMYENDRY